MAVVGTAYILGGYTSDFKHDWQAKKQKQEMTTSILANMDTTIEVGRKLPDFTLQDPEGNQVQLSDVVCAQSIIAFSLPGCGYSVKELQNLKVLGLTPDDELCFIFISDDHPTELMYYRQEYELKCRILYDENREYMKSLGVFTSPFNVIVNSALYIRDIRAGNLSGEEIKEYLGCK